MPLKEMIQELSSLLDKKSKDVPATIILSKLLAIKAELKKEPSPQIDLDVFETMSNDLRTICLQGALFIIGLSMS